MNLKWIQLCVALLSFSLFRLFAETGSTNAPKHALRFRNGDTLLGNLESIDARKKVTWRRADVADPIEFIGTNISEIKFSHAKNPASGATNLCHLHFHNGDSLTGSLTLIDSEKIILETVFAGKMIFPRAGVRAIEPVTTGGELIFAGPTGMDGWTQGKVTAATVGEPGEWKYTNGAFYATRAASIARDVKLPDVARIQFDLGWKDMLQAAIALYTSHLQPINLGSKETEPDFGGFYSLQINSFVATLMPVKKTAPLIYLGQVPVPTFSQKNRAHLEILVNKPRASVALLVDGVFVREWVDPDGFAGTGTAMRFVHQGQGAVKLSNLRIAEWNGKLEQTLTNEPALKEDSARLLNGDRVFGLLDTFRDGKFVFSVSNRKLDIPLARVSEIEFPATKFVDEKVVAPIRVFLINGDSVTCRLEQWNQQGVKCFSPHFGNATFLPTAFERVELYLPVDSVSAMNRSPSP
ncbi:MAG: hypothetical protein ABI042_01010 [Verrucomicrobiota bacterium]